MTYALKGRFPSGLMNKAVWYYSGFYFFFGVMFGWGTGGFHSEGWVGTAFTVALSVAYGLAFASIFLVRHYPCGDCQLCWDGRQTSCPCPIRLMEYRRRKKQAEKEAAILRVADQKRKSERGA